MHRGGALPPALTPPERLPARSRQNLVKWSSGGKRKPLFTVLLLSSSNSSLLHTLGSLFPPLLHFWTVSPSEVATTHGKAAVGLTVRKACPAGKPNPDRQRNRTEPKPQRRPFAASLLRSGQSSGPQQSTSYAGQREHREAGRLVLKHQRRRPFASSSASRLTTPSARPYVSGYRPRRTAPLSSFQRFS